MIKVAKILQILNPMHFLTVANKRAIAEILYKDDVKSVTRNWRLEGWYLYVDQCFEEIAVGEYRMANNVRMKGGTYGMNVREWTPALLSRKMFIEGEKNRDKIKLLEEDASHPMVMDDIRELENDGVWFNCNLAKPILLNEGTLTIDGEKREDNFIFELNESTLLDLIMAVEGYNKQQAEEDFVVINYTADFVKTFLKLDKLNKGEGFIRIREGT